MYLNSFDKPILIYLHEQLPFVLFREILDHMPCFKKDRGWACWTMLRYHYDRRVCSRCGEFMDSQMMYMNMERPRKRVCLCKWRAHVYDAKPRLRVYIRPSIRTQGINRSLFHSISTSTLQMIQHNSSLEEMHFLVDHQLETVYNFRRVIAFLECIRPSPEENNNSSSSMIRNLLIDVLCELLVDEMKNIRSYPLFVQQKDPPTVPSPWNEVELSTAIHWKPFSPFLAQELSSQKQVSLPFTMPVRYFYPSMYHVRDLPVNARSSFLKFFKDRWSLIPSIVPYDPLHLLSHPEAVDNTQDP